MATLEDLQQAVLRHSVGPITASAVPGLTLYHADTDTPAAADLVYKPMICLMAQGEKKVLLGDSVFRYTPAQYLLSSVHLPVRGIVTNAAPGRPYLALSLAIDKADLAELLLSLPPAPADAEPACGLAMGTVNPDLLDGFVRLTRLLDTPAAIAPLAPLITREILYRLLQGEHAHMLRGIATRGSRTAQIARTLKWLRKHYAEPFSMQKLCTVANMSPASLHRHFRVVTAMSPLQYQKRVRLQEARRLLVSEGENAATAAFQVGYNSPSQFSREYSRTFGKPPRQDTSHRLTQTGPPAIL